MILPWQQETKENKILTKHKPEKQHIKIAAYNPSDTPNCNNVVIEKCEKEKGK